VIRDAVYRVDLSGARGHEQRGRRYGVVLSPSDSKLSVVTVVPTSTSAAAAITRPLLEIAGRPTRVLIDQIRTVDIDYVHGEPVDYLTRDALAEIEHALAHYLGLAPGRPDSI